MSYRFDNTPVLESLYHKGQDNIWDGKNVLQSLISEHGLASFSEKQLNSINNIFSVILWGELAAWNISSSLALGLTSIEAKMAATSQAHDEARHFYVMKDYLNTIGCVPKELPANTLKTLNFVSKANSLPKKLLGMQLMVEPIAITIFKLVIKSNVDPVLSGLLKLYEKDEARHIALGVKHLPILIDKMTYNEIISLFMWQLKLMLLEVDGLKDLQNDFEALGFSVDEVYYLAENKQMEAAKKMGDELGMSHKAWDAMRLIAHAKKEITFNNKYKSLRMFLPI